MVGKSLSHRKLLLPILLIVLIIIACRFGIVSAPPTPPSTPTTISILPTEFSTPTISLQSEVTIPDPQFTEAPLAVSPEESILIEAPQSGSHISGALSIQGISDPTFEQNLVIRLLDQNGSELLLTNTIIQADAGNRGNFSASVNIPSGPSQPALLQIYATSPKDGSLTHLTSAGIFINSEHLEAPPLTNMTERILIKSIAESGTGANAIINITGAAWGLFENTLNYAVCGENSGKLPDLVCGSMENRLTEGFVTIDAADMGKLGEFTITISNKVPIPPSASIVVYSISPMNGAIDHAESHRLISDD